MLGAVKLAWWRESLEALDRGPPPGEPRLRAAARELVPRGLGGADLAAMEEPWALILAEKSRDPSMPGVAMRGSRLFGLAARLLGPARGEPVDDWGRLFSLADLGRRGSFDLSPVTFGRPGGSVPRSARPLSMLAALARRDLRSGGPPFEPEATPARAWALLRHRLSGRL